MAYEGGGWGYPTPSPYARPDMPWGDVYAPPNWPGWNQWASLPAGTAGQAGASSYAPSQQGWYGGGGGGRQPTGPAPWAGGIGWGAIPWETYAETPWANVPKGRGREAMQWYSTMLPWQQAQMQAQQWGTEFDWRKASDVWRQGFEQEQFGLTKEQSAWSQAFQQSQLEQQAVLERERQESEKAAASMATYGRWRKPTPRWA